MTKLQILNKQNKDLKIQNKNLKNKIKTFEEEREEYKKKIEQMDKKFAQLFAEIGRLNEKVVEVTEENKKLRSENKQLRKDLSKANETIDKLKNRLKKDSSNSSKPPSSDGPKKKIHSTRKKTSNKVGGQVGHKGSTLTLSNEPTEIHQLVAEDTKCDCGGSVHFSDECLSKKQIIDIKFVVDIIEYQNSEGFCGKCNTRYITEFPFDIDSVVHYGENLKTLVTLLSNEGMVATKRTVGLINELSNGKIKLSMGTVVNFNKELATKSSSVLEEIKEYLISVNVLFVDETGVRINGKQNWLHTACNEDATLYMVHKKKGNAATEEMGILAYYVGVLMHDHLKSYYKYETMKHAECNAHILRYLKSIIDIFKREEAKKLLEFLVKTNNEKKEMQLNGKENLMPNEYENKRNEYLNILKDWKSKYLEAINGKKNISYYNDEKCLIERLIEFSEEHLRFIKDFTVPFDNNMAERSLRMIKTKIKVSGCFRSEDGSSNFAKIRSIIDTSKKQGLNLVKVITNIFKENPISII